jgi:ankyrin repeat protein
MRQLHLGGIVLLIAISTVSTSFSASTSRENTIALVQASTRGDTVKVEELLTSGVDVNSRHALTGWTALMAASLYGKVDTVKALLRAGAKTNLGDNNRSTALMKAVQTMPEEDESTLMQRKAEIITLLLNAGADPSLEDKFAANPWQVAIDRNETLLVEVFEKNRVSGVKETKLMLAIAANNLKEAQRLIQEGAKVNYRDSSGANSLSEAVLSGNLEMLRIVIQADAALDAKFDKGWTALMLAVQRNQPEMVRLLVAAGANTALQNDADQTALQIAELAGNNTIIEILKNK